MREYICMTLSPPWSNTFLMGNHVFVASKHRKSAKLPWHHNCGQLWQKSWRRWWDDDDGEDGSWKLPTNNEVVSKCQCKVSIVPHYLQLSEIYVYRTGGTHKYTRPGGNIASWQLLRTSQTVSELQLCCILTTGATSQLELPPGTRATFQLRTSSYFDSGDTVDSGFWAGLIGTSSLSGSWEQFTLSISENFYMLINCTSTTNQVIPITPPKWNW